MKNVSAEMILDLARGRFAHAEVFEESGESLSVSFEDNRLKEIKARQFHGVGLRVIDEGRIGFASTTDLRDPTRLVEMAAASARFGDEARFEMPGPADRCRAVETYDDAVPRVTAGEMVDMGRAALEMSRRANQNYQFHAGVSRSTHCQHVLNTSGLDHRFDATSMSAHAGIEEAGENGILHVSEFKGWGRRLDGLLDLAGTVLEKAEQAATIAPVRKDALPVVFTPKAVGTLLQPLAVALNGKHVLKGSSVLAGRVGEQVLDERITLGEDPTIPFAPATCALDDEGTPTRKWNLIEGGVLKGFISDRQTAGLLGCEPSGNGFRGHSSRPAPSTTNAIVAGGDTPYQEMIVGLERGLIVDEVLGGGQSNVLAGEFSVNVALGFLVENGQVVGRVKDCMVAGNVYELLKDRLDAVGSERQWIGSSYRPAVMLGGVTLATGA